MKSGDVEPWPCVEEEPNATITTGSPAASSLATRGSDTIFLAPPFGGRQGTRLKMSPADFATSLTFSIALEVTLFCCGLAGVDGGNIAAGRRRRGRLRSIGFGAVGEGGLLAG